MSQGKGKGVEGMNKREVKESNESEVAGMALVMECGKGELMGTERGGKARERKGREERAECKLEGKIKLTKGGEERDDVYEYVCVCVCLDAALLALCSTWLALLAGNRDRILSAN